jgi:hypothetical protein
MFDIPINSPFSTVIAAPSDALATDAVLYLGSSEQDSTAANLAFSIQGMPPGVWRATFTPTSVGVYSLFVFGKVQFQIQVTNKSLYTSLHNIEGEALGSWTWDKTTGSLRLVDHLGSPLGTFAVRDTLTGASRERV